MNVGDYAQGCCRVSYIRARWGVSEGGSIGIHRIDRLAATCCTVDVKLDSCQKPGAKHVLELVCAYHAYFILSSWHPWNGQVLGADQTPEKEKLWTMRTHILEPAPNRDVEWDDKCAVIAVNLYEWRVC